MALPHTILAALSVQPQSGYDLAKKFAEGNGCYWRATQQQIYRELAKLEAQGRVTAETVPQEGRPDKKQYFITESGRSHLREWLAEPAEPTPIREELLVKVMAAHLVPRSVILQELARRRQLHQQLLSTYQELYQHLCANFPNQAPEVVCQCLTLRRGIRYETDWIEWCDEALAIFENLNDIREGAFHSAEVPDPTDK